MARNLYRALLAFGALVLLMRPGVLPAQDMQATTLQPLSGSLVVPLVIWDHAEVTPPDGKRLLSATQIGSKASRHLWLTSAVREQWKANVESRQQEIATVFSSRDVKPFWITGGFNAESLSRYFMEIHV